jgi:hypothetical protein
MIVCGLGLEWVKSAAARLSVFGVELQRVVRGGSHDDRHLGVMIASKGSSSGGLGLTGGVVGPLNHGANGWEHDSQIIRELKATGGESPSGDLTILP